MLSGGIFNVFGDYFFVFTCGMGICGAGLATAIVRTYALSFLLLPFNIFSTYYFQAIMKPHAAFVVSVARGLVISGILILALPALVSADAIWFAMPVTELLAMLCAAVMIRKYTGSLPGTACADMGH